MPGSKPRAAPRLLEPQVPRDDYHPRQGALAVAPLGPLGAYEMNGGDAKRGGVTQDVAGRLWPGKADQKGGGVWLRTRCAPRKRKRDHVCADRIERRFPPRPVEETDIE